MKRVIPYLVLILAAVYVLPAEVQAKKTKEIAVKNVIWMIGDGMGVAQVSALMLENGFEPINMERATAVGLVKTYSANNRVTDSAAAATAFATGHKTDNSRVGIDSAGNSLESIMKIAARNSYATGFIVTSGVTDATPAGFYANAKSRHEHEKMALQLTQSGIDFFMGGGRKYFESREDSVDLIKVLKENDYKIVYDIQQAADIERGKVAGLVYEKPYMQLARNGRGDYLAKATAKALQVLGNNSKKGFFLMVEGSQIDGGGHQNKIDMIVNETRDFDDAVKVAMDYADQNPGTLVLVTADHETGGLALASNDSDFTSSESGIKYCFSTNGHTASLTPLFAYGTQANRFSRVMENTQLFYILSQLLNLK